MHATVRRYDGLDTPTIVERESAPAEQTPLAQFRCEDCGYGASRATAPDRCPMCGERAWAVDDLPPLSRPQGR